MKTAAYFILTLLFFTGCSKSDQQTSNTNSTEMTAVIQVPTAKCESCEATITKAVKSVNGVKTVEMNLDKKEIKVTYASIIDIDAIRLAIVNAGYDADSTKRNSDSYSKLDECCQ